MSEKKRLPKDILRGIGGIVVALTAMSCAFALAFVLTALLFPRIGFEPSPLVQQVINSMLGMFLLALTGIVVGQVMRRAGWGQQTQMLMPLLNAIDQIARGDFSVRVEQINGRNSRQREDDPFNTLFVSVNRMAEELSKMEILRQEFISNVSHEIQSPLTSIRGFAHALRDDALGPQERAHYLNIIETESMRLSKLSDNLLALASLEKEGLPFEPKPYHLDLQIKAAILVSEPQWAGKGITLELDMEEVTITGGEDLLNQVWVNLIHNAIKFTPQHGRICVSLHRRDDHAEFTIADTGIGISEEDQQRIFERFFKADASRNREIGGSGLGLSIASKIVELHHGNIRVQSVADAGGTFVVSLPLVYANVVTE